MRNDQTGLAKIPEEVLEQNLCAKIKKVCRLVKQQQVRLVQQQRRSFTRVCQPPESLANGPSR